MKKLFVIAFLFILAAPVFAQTSQGNDSTRYIWYKFQYGSRQPRFWADSALVIPPDTTFSKSGIARKGTDFYIGNGSYWTKVSGTGTIINPAPGVDSVKFTLTTICVYPHGAPTECYEFSRFAVDIDQSDDPKQYKIINAKGDSINAFPNYLKHAYGAGNVIVRNGGVGADGLDSLIVEGSPIGVDSADFRWSAVNILNTPAVSPGVADIYLVGTAPTGTFVGHANQVATWNGSAYTYELPTVGDLLYNQSNASVYKYTGTAWILVGKQPFLVGGQNAITSPMVIGPINGSGFDIRTTNLNRLRITNAGVIQLTSLASAGTGVVGIDAAGNLSKVQQSIPQLTFQFLVKDSLSTPASLPDTGSIYLVGTSPTGAFVGHANQIATWNGTAYTYQTAANGNLLFNATTGYGSQLTGGTWVRITQPVVHLAYDETITGKKEFTDTLLLQGAKGIKLKSTPFASVNFLTTNSGTSTYPWLDIGGNAGGSVIRMGANNPGSAADMLRIVANYHDSIVSGQYRDLWIDAYDFLAFRGNRSSSGSDSSIRFYAPGGGVGAFFNNTGQLKSNLVAGYTLNNASLYTPRSWTDKNYVDSSIAAGGGGGGGTYTVSRGLNALGNNFRLGGTLDSAVNIATSSNPFAISDGIHNALSVDPIGDTITLREVAASGVESLLKLGTDDGSDATVQLRSTNPVTHDFGDFNVQPSSMNFYSFNIGNPFYRVDAQFGQGNIAILQQNTQTGTATLLNMSHPNDDHPTMSLNASGALSSSSIQITDTAINISGPILRINGSLYSPGGGGGSGTVSSGTANRLGYYSASGTTISNLAAITANRALISDANGLPVHSAVTNTELGYLSGATSSIQAQLSARPDTSTLEKFSNVGLADKDVRQYDATNGVWKNDDSLNLPTGAVTAANGFVGKRLMGGHNANDTLRIGGNDAASGNTTTAQNVVIGVGNSMGTAAMTVLNNGRIGISNNAPPYLATIGVVNTATAGSFPTGNYLYAGQANSGANAALFFQTAASSSTNGGRITVGVDDGAALASGDQVGVLQFSGSASSALLRTPVTLEAFATENFSGTVNGGKLNINITPNGAATRPTIGVFTSVGLGVGGSNVPTSTLQTVGSFATGYVAKTANYTATVSDYTIDCTSGSFTVTLPTAVGIAGRIYVVKNSGAGSISVATTSSQTIDGSATFTLGSQYKYVVLQSNNATWIVTGNN